MEDSNTSKKSLVSIIIVVIIVLVGGYFLRAGGEEGGGSGAQNSTISRVVETKPGLTDEQLLGKAEVPETQLNAVVAHKQDILKRVVSSKPLTDAEKQTIGNIMLTQAHIYGFTAEEREAVFAALRR